MAGVGETGAGGAHEGGSVTSMQETTIGTCRLIHADCHGALPLIEDFDLVITSPPYNLGASPWPHIGNWQPGDGRGRSKWRNSSGGCGDIQYLEHADSMPWPAYVAWQQQTLSLLWERLPSHGAIFYNHKPRVIGAQLWTPLELLPPGVILRQIIIWSRPGGINFNATAFVPTHEWLLLLAKPDFRLKSKGVSGLGDVWPMAPDTNSHPAPFPLALPLRILEATSATHMIDPFAGSFTTGVAAAQYGIAFTGCDKVKTYWELGCQRIEDAYAQLDLWRPCKAERAKQMALL